MKTDELSQTSEWSYAYIQPTDSREHNVKPSADSRRQDAVFTEETLLGEKQKGNYSMVKRVSFKEVYSGISIIEAVNMR